MTEPHLPTLRTEDLNGRELSLPQDLPAERTLLLVAFEREQQADIETWVSGMTLDKADFAWLITPVIQEPGRLMRTMIDTGMRAGIRDKAARAQVVTLYTNRETWLSSMGLSDVKTIYALVVDRRGRVLAQSAGKYNDAGAQELRAALNA